MRGVPKWFNTIEDVQNSMEADKAVTKAELQKLLDARMVWFPVGKAIAPGITSATAKVVPMKDEESGEEYLMQYELREDENAWMFRIGLTVKKINELLEA